MITPSTLPALLGLLTGLQAPPDRKPNIVYLMADELAYYELGHMGNPYLRTPRVDQMAREGLRFTHALASAPVCAPLRCALMTGKHMGNASVRANDGGTPLRADEITIATILKRAGYATGGFGKWGAGGRGSTGVPEAHGFDVFFGYYDQVHAHSFYPAYLVRNSQEVALEGNEGGRTGQSYSHYRIMDEALDFIRDHKDSPFFCYMPVTPPHGMYDIPEDDPAWGLYEDDSWIADPSLSSDARSYAAMVSMLDRDLGRVLDLLEELGLAEDTIVFFTGDNGGHDRFRDKDHPCGFYGPNLNPTTGIEFRGGKGNLYDGGLRIPFLVRWPGRVLPARVSGHLFTQADVFPTLAELAGEACPPDLDGLSLIPEILGAEAAGREQDQHSYLYWEFGSQFAVREGDWKAIQPGKDKPWELYDLAGDPGEQVDLAAENPGLVTRLVSLAKKSHTPARPGRYFDRIPHERDRAAKWGSTRPRPPGKTLHRLSKEGLAAFDEVQLLSCSSESLSNGKVGTNAIDGHPGTVWHTRWADGLAEHPHELVLDLGRSRKVLGIRYLARQDGSWNGTFGRTQLWVGETTDDLSGSPHAEQVLQKIRSEQSIALPQPVTGRYLKILVLDEVQGGPWASAADIGVVIAP